MEILTEGTENFQKTNVPANVKARGTRSAEVIGVIPFTIQVNVKVVDLFN